MLNNIHKNQIWAVVPAAGSGKRMNTEIPKQYIKIFNKTIIEHTLQVLIDHPKISKIVVTVSADDNFWLQLPVFKSDKIIVVHGGAERFISVSNGLTALNKLAEPDDWVLVHDAVRPCLLHDDIDRLINQLALHSVGGLLGAPVYNTLKQVDEHMNVVATIDRSKTWQALTPQMFRYHLLKRALEYVAEQKITITDEAAAVEAIGEKPLMAEGDPKNIKITTIEDLQLAAQYLLRNENKC